MYPYARGRRASRKCTWGKANVELSIQRLFVVQSVMSNSLWPHGLQYTRLPWHSLSLTVCANSCPLSWWCHPAISSSVIPFFSCPQSFPVSGSVPKSQLSHQVAEVLGAWASASVLPMSIQSWFPLGLTGLILLSKGFPRIFSRTTFWKHQDYKSAITNIFSILKEICLKNKGMYGNFISPRREF